MYRIRTCREAMIRALKFTKGTQHGVSVGVAERRAGRERERERKERKREREREKKVEATLGFTRHVTLMKIAEDEL